MVCSLGAYGSSPVGAGLVREISRTLLFRVPSVCQNCWRDGTGFTCARAPRREEPGGGGAWRSLTPGGSKALNHWRPPKEGGGKLLSQPAAGDSRWHLEFLDNVREVHVHVPWPGGSRGLAGLGLIFSFLQASPSNGQEGEQELQPGAPGTCVLLRRFSAAGLRESLKHAVPDYSVRGTAFFFPLGCQLKK